MHRTLPHPHERREQTVREAPHHQTARDAHSSPGNAPHQAKTPTEHRTHKARFPSPRFTPFAFIGARYTWSAPKRQAGVSAAPQGDPAAASTPDPTTTRSHTPHHPSSDRH